MPPPPHVVAAFGGSGKPSPLPGGRGSSWRCGDVVLKPAASPEDVLAWQATQLPAMALRLARPLRSTIDAYASRTDTARASNSPGSYGGSTFILRGNRRTSSSASLPRFSNRNRSTSCGT